LDKIREAFPAPLMGCFRRMSWCAFLIEGRTAFVREKVLYLVATENRQKWRKSTETHDTDSPLLAGK